MIAFVFAPLLIVALICLALSSRVPTRWLGLLGALACAGAAGVLIAAPWDALELAPLPWATLAEQTIALSLRFSPANWPFALLVTAGGALALLSLALALPEGLRGFGGFFAALLLLLAATLAGLAVQDITLLAFVWAVTALLGFCVLRASGAYAIIGMPLGLLAGLASALAVLGVALVLLVGTAATPLVALVGLVAVLAVAGAPPFHHAVDETAAAPAGIAGPLLALGLPLIGGAALVRFASDAALVNTAGRTVLSAVGVLTLVTCAAGALGERRLSQLLGWQWSAQIGLVLVACGQSPEIAAQLGAGLLANAALSTLAGYLAVGVLERQTGTDDLDAFAANQSLLLPGIAFTVAAASAVGVPGTWGFVLREGLFAAPNQPPWSTPLLLAGSALLAVAFLAPVAAFWRVGNDNVPRQTASLIVELVVPLLLALPLLLLGVLVPPLFGAAPAAPGLAQQLIAAGAAVLLLLLPLLSRRVERVYIDPEARSSAPAPDALAASVRWVAWLAAPEVVYRGAWSGLQGGGQLLRRGLALFEQRYYLAGVMIAVVMVLLLLL